MCETMYEPNGIIMLLIVIVVSVLGCIANWILFPVEKETERDRILNRLVLRCISPKGQGVPIDEVIENLDGVDLSGFHLEPQQS